MVSIESGDESIPTEELTEDEPPEDTATTDSSIEVTSGDESYTRDELDSGAHEPTGSRTYVGGADETSGPTITSGDAEVTQDEAEAIARGEATATEPATRTPSTATATETASATDSISGASAEQGLETETAPRATEAEQGTEREGGRIGNRARKLEQQFLAQNPGFTAADVTVVRSGDTLRARLTESAKRRATIEQAQSLELQFLEDVGLEDPTLVRIERSEDGIVASLNRAGEQALAGLDIADQLSEQYGPGGFDPGEDFTLTRADEGGFTAELTEEGRSLVEYLQDEDSARTRPAGRPPVTTIERYERYEAQEDTARPATERVDLTERIEGAVGAQRAESAGVVGARLRRGIVEGVTLDPTRDIEFTAEDGTLGATLSATGQRREAAMEFSQQYGVAVDPSEVRLDDEGGATLGPEARRRVSTRETTALVADIERRGTEALRGAAASAGVGTDIEVDLPGEGPLAPLDTGEGDGRGLPDQAVFFRTGLESEGGPAPSQRRPAEGSRVRLEDALSGASDAIGEFVEPRTGAFAEQYVPPGQRADLRARAEDEQFSTVETRRQELASATIEGLAESPSLIPGGALAVKNVADVGVGTGAAYATGDRERLGEIREGVEATAAETAVMTTETAARDPGAFAARGAGTLVGSAFLFGGAAAVGPRTSLATRAVIQPGEEVLGFGLHYGARGAGRAVRRPEAGKRLASRIAPNKEPIFFSEEAAIRTARGAAARTRQAAGRARARIRGEAEPRGVIPEGGLEPATGGAFEGYFTRSAPEAGPGRFGGRVYGGIPVPRARPRGEIEQEPTDPLEESLERMERAQRQRYDEFRQRMRERHEVIRNPYRQRARAEYESEVERRRRRAEQREVETRAEAERVGRLEQVAQRVAVEPGAVEVPRATARADVRGDIEQRQELRLDLESDIEQDLRLELLAEQEIELETEFEYEGESELEYEVGGQPRERRRRREPLDEGFSLDFETFEAPVASAREIATGQIEEEAGLGDFFDAPTR